MKRTKRKGSTKQPHIISNTGFIGSVFIDTLELQKRHYYFSRKKLQLTHHVLDGLAQAMNALFTEHAISAYLSCVYLHTQKKIGYVLSVKPFEKAEGISYFTNYLIEKNFYTGEEKEYQEIFSTGFIGAAFADLSGMERFTFGSELKILSKLIKNMIIPVKELFLRHGVPAYISGVELEDQNKLGFVLSRKPYDEQAEAVLYFTEYLKERGFYEAESEDDTDRIVIRKTVQSL
ncbi:hypothetical protein [Bacillus sp. 165]|uniref:hypothetical protein n=1 Tax=Bacillus sp. 165 TaxID=1529117 RepID=UPI001ADADA17|nr:hypothetical protein [Bacillus sp. 165]